MANNFDFRLIEREKSLLICTNKKGEMWRNNSKLLDFLKVDEKQATIEGLIDSSLVLNQETKNILKEKICTGQGFEIDQDIRVNEEKLIHLHFILEIAEDIKLFFVRDESEVTFFKRKYQEMNNHLLDTLAVVAHETMNPLVSMILFSKKCLKELRSGNAFNLGRLIDLLEGFEEQAKKMEKIIKDLLFKEELEHKGFPLCKERIKDLYQEVIMDVLADPDIARAFAQKRVTIDHKSSLVKASVFGDKLMLRVVYRNLFENAIRYLPSEGRITYGIEEKDGNYELIVYNDGRALNEDLIGKIFEKRKGDGKSTGLGLYFCKKIVELHEGKIWAEENREEGVKIIFTLPKY